MHSQCPVAELYCNKTLSIVLTTVVEGSVTFVVDPNEAPQVIPLAVPLSVIWIISISPLLGVPLKPVVIEVMAWANPVIEAMSIVSVFMDGVAD